MKKENLVTNPPTFSGLTYYHIYGILGIVTKTTVYLDERELRALKDLANRLRGMSAARLIREAVRDLLRRKKTAPSFRLLRKHLSKKPQATPFGDPVRYQRALRRDWN